MLLCSWQQSRISLRELSISSLVIVVKVSRVKRVRPCKRIVNLYIPLPSLLNLSAALPTSLQTALLSLPVHFKSPLHFALPNIKLLTVQIIIILACRLALSAQVAII